MLGAPWEHKRVEIRLEQSFYIDLSDKEAKTRKAQVKTTISHMIAVERHKIILKRTHKLGAVKTSVLAQEFSVSEETIRRDLDKLTETGLLVRTHGGATSHELQRFEIDLALREGQQHEEKKAVAHQAVNLINSGETILLDASSTVLQLAAIIPDSAKIHVVTYSQAVAELLSRRGTLKFTLLGGCFDPPSRSYFGLLTESALRHLRIDRFFFSCKGVDPKMGLSDAISEHAKLKKAILEHSETSCLLADHSKIGLRSNYFFAPLEKIPTMIVDSAVSNSAFTELEQTNIEILISES